MADDTPKSAVNDAEPADSDRLDRILEALSGLADKPDPPKKDLRGILTSEGQAKILHHVMTAICAVVLARLGGLELAHATDIIGDSASQIGVPVGVIGGVVGLFQWLRRDA